MRKLIALIIGVVVSTGALAAAPDEAGELNELIAGTLRMARIPLAEQAPTFLFAHLAMFDVVNAVAGNRYVAFSAPAKPPSGASAPTAALGAVCAVLIMRLSEHREAIEKECAGVAARIAAQSSDASAAYGREVARALIEARRQEIVPNAYRPFAAPGVYVPTTLPVGWEIRTARPFAMLEPGQFRPGPPPALSSATWERDYNEVKRLGGRDARQRTDEQTAVARFWSPSGGAIFNPLIRQAAAAAGPSLVERARVFALAYVVMTDAAIAVLDAKYTYNFWRPVTAIRNGDIDGNDATGREAGWLPLVDAPMHPEYPCAHCITSAAVGEVLMHVLGSGALRTPLAMRAPGIQDANASMRSWSTVPDFVTEVSDSRVWAGIHYRNSTEVGAAMGRQIGRYVVDTAFRLR